MLHTGAHVCAEIQRVSDGRKAFAGTSYLFVLHAVAYDEPKLLGGLVRSVPAGLERVNYPCAPKRVGSALSVHDGRTVGAR